MDGALLKGPFSLEDLKAVIWEGVGDKSPDPDGFNMSFYRACWDFVNEDLLKVVEEFYRGFRVPKEITTSFITLITKMYHP